jgi:hypothetical protein
MLLATLLTVGAAACGGDDDGGSAANATSSSSSSSSSSTSRATTSSSSSSSTTKKPATPEEEVEAAYLKSWDVYAKAVRELDPSGLEEAYAKDALQTVRDEVARLASDGTPIRVDVTHAPALVVEFLRPDAAVVFDAYVNRSVLIDGTTGEPLEEPDGKTIQEAYQLERVDGLWKVVFIRRS